VSLQKLMDEDRRLVILRILSEAHDYSLNESLIERALAHFRLGVVGRDLLRAHLAWLQEHGLVKLERLDLNSEKELWVAKLTKTGQEVAQGRPWPGIARPSPAA
jgi:DNA-binding transcriptional ArsR family regulator